VWPDRPGSWPEGFVRSPSDRDAALALAHLRTLPPRDLLALARREGTASRCAASIREGRIGTQADRDAVGGARPDRVRRRLTGCGGWVAFPGDPDYPDPLLDLPDPPVCLFGRGGPLRGLYRPGEPPNAAAVVGARKATPYGEEIAGLLGAGLAGAGVVVVSGAALGIDAGAHRGALRAGGPTVAVLGSGIDVAYPRMHEGLLAEIARSGAVVTEYPPGVPARSFHFPARNRIIAALARVTVVVEGAPGSGSVITATFAGELGRDVLAVPGPVTSPLSAAPHALIREGAGLVGGLEDVLASLGAAGAPPGSSIPPDLPEPDRRVLDHLSAPATAELVARAAGMDPARVLSSLVSLELRGLVRSVGGRFERTALAGAC
jgi:DNA processing protein